MIQNFKGKDVVKIKFDVMIERGDNIPSDAEEYWVIWKRGSRRCNCGETDLKKNEKNRIVWNQSFSLFCTMFRSDNTKKI